MFITKARLGLAAAVTALTLIGAGCTPATVNQNVPGNANVPPVTNGNTNTPAPAGVAFGADVTLGVGDAVRFTDGLNVTLKVINDSRCPADVQCIWAGELAPVLEVSGGKFESSQEVILGTTTALTKTAGGYDFALTSATATSVVIKVTPTELASQ